LAGPKGRKLPLLLGPSGPFAFDDPEKLTDGRDSRVFAATGGGYLWRACVLLLAATDGHTGGK
jgi:hypothetical protein